MYAHQMVHWFLHILPIRIRYDYTSVGFIPQIKIVGSFLNVVNSNFHIVKREN